MRGKAISCHSRKTKNGNILLLGQQLQLTIKQIGTKNDNMVFLNRRLLLVFRMFDLTILMSKSV